MSQYDDAISAFLNAEKDHGLGLGDLLPRGVYPVEIEKVQGAETTNPKTKDSVSYDGGVSVRLQLRVLDGPFAERRVFVRHALVNIFDPARKGSKFYNMSSTFVQSIGAKLAQVDPRNFENLAKASLAMYNTAGWEKLRFIAEVGVETAEKQAKGKVKNGGEATGDEQDRNVLAGWHSWDSEDEGFAQWKEKHLPAQLKKAAKGKPQTAAAGPGGAVKF